MFLILSSQKLSWSNLLPKHYTAGSRVRAALTLLKAEPIENRGRQLTWEVTTEREGVAKPVCIAESIARLYP